MGGGTGPDTGEVPVLAEDGRGGVCRAGTEGLAVWAGEGAERRAGARLKAQPPCIPRSAFAALAV